MPTLAPQNELTPREEQVVALVAEGCSNPDIARELEIGAETVKRHLYVAMRKTGMGNRLELALWQLQRTEQTELAAARRRILELENQLASASRDFEARLAVVANQRDTWRAWCGWR